LKISYSRYMNPLKRKLYFSGSFHARVEAPPRKYR
jgi:hypothetical protein